MAKIHNQLGLFRAGLTAEGRLGIPRVAADPTAPSNGDIWLNSGDNVVRFREDGVTYTLARGSDALDAEQIRDIVATALQGSENVNVVVDDSGDTITLSVTGLDVADVAGFQAAVDGRISGVVTKAFVDGLAVNAATLGNSSLTDVLAAARAAIVAGQNITVTNSGGTVTIAVEDLTVADLTDYVAATNGRIDGRVTKAFVDALGVNATALAGETPDTIIDSALGSIAAGANLAVAYTPGGALTLSVTGLATGDLSDYDTATDGRIDARVTKAFVDALSVNAGTVGGATRAQLTADALGAVDAGNNIDVTVSGGRLTISVEDLSSADITDFNTAAVAAVNATTLDADTLNNMTADQIRDAAIEAITGDAPEALDTLNEIATRLADDADAAAALTNAVAARSRFFSVTLPATAASGGVAEAVVTHDLGTTDVIVQVRNVVTGWVEEFGVGNFTPTTVTIRSEAGAIDAATYRVNITTAA